MQQRDADNLVVYTVIMDDVYHLPPVQDGQDVPRLCFPDQRLDPNGWQIVPTAPILPADLPRSSRDPRIRPHRFLPDHGRSLYIDPTVGLRAPAEAIWAALMPDPGHVLGCMHHSFRATLRDEFNVVEAAALEHSRILHELHDMLRTLFPETLAQRPVWGGILARRHHHTVCVDAMERWYAHILRYARRDQLTLPMILSQMPQAARHIAALDNRSSAFHDWPVAGHTRPQRYMQGYRRNPIDRRLRRLFRRAFGRTAF